MLGTSSNLIIESYIPFDVAYEEEIRYSIWNASTATFAEEVNINGGPWLGILIFLVKQ